MVDGEAVLLHADSSAYFGVNQAGTLLWSRLAAQPQTSEQVAAWARNYFRDTPEEVLSEISAFLGELFELHLIEIVDGEDTAEDGSSMALVGGGAPVTWEKPTLERFGELERLILSGE